MLVLCYHGVSDDWPAVTAVTPGAFADQMRYLAAKGYRGTTFTQALIAPPPGRSVAVTFDDAHLSVRELAWPVLAELGWPGTMFAPTDFLAERRPLLWWGTEEWVGTRHAGELTPMSWDELGELADAGWEIGSHTCSHPHLTWIARDEVERELTESREELARRLGRPCESIAYPYGDVNDGIAAAARAAGYRTGAGAPGGFVRGLPMRWPRVVVDRTHGARRFALRADPRVRRLLSVPLVRRMRRQPV